MNTSKLISTLPIQAMHTNATNTPLRRRSALNLTQAASPIVENLRFINDDEEERRNSRRFGTVESGSNLAEAADSLNSCLKLFAENKISKDNAWNLNIIDSFSKLIKKHHHSLSNFQVAGSTLEASTKVYSLRVDSVYTDVIRMSSDLSRQTAKTLTKRNQANFDDDEDGADGSGSGIEENDKENMDANQLDSTQMPKAKQKTKKRRHVATVTKNPDTLNARLDTHPLVDPFFAKLNSMVGDINSSKRLMQNIIPTKESKLKLRQNILMWDRNETTIANLEETFNFKTLNPEEVATVSPIINNIEDLVLRSGLKKYRICDLPLESVEEVDSSIRQYNDDSVLDANQTMIGRSISNVDLQFDINAEVEPILNDKSFVMDFGDMNNHDFDDVEEDQREALSRCRGLKRQPILIEDMQPETSAALSDYSYRPLDNIDQFWAGPSHWKFRYSRRTQLSCIESRSSIQVASTSGISEVAAIQQRPKTVRKRKIVRRSDISLEDARNADEHDTLFLEKGKSRSKQITVQIMTKRWDSKKHKLPMDYRVSSETFDTFSHAKAILINTDPDATFTGVDNEEDKTYNYDNDLDRNYCSRVDMQSSDTETDLGQMDNNLEFEICDMLPPPAPQPDEIPDFYVGAPDRIEKISIAFARRAKVVDMKQLKHCSLNIIIQKMNTNPRQQPCFSEILRELPKHLKKAMAENMSMPLAFYAILHLCNDQGLLLTPNDSLEDFDISFL